MQQILLGVGAKKKTYMEDIYSTYLWNGNGADRTITTGVDIKGEGGMIWVKKRNASNYHIIADTERDDPSLNGQSYLATNEDDAQTGDTNGIKYYYNTGFMVGSGGHVNANSSTYSSYSFRKAPGFFDVVKYTGNDTAGRTISHSLGSKPGMIWVKRIDTADSWFVYHRELGATKRLYLNNNSVPATVSTAWNDTEPTSSVFTLGADSGVNGSGGTYVAYLFAGGESTAATARSVRFDGSNDYLFIHPSTDFDMGTGDFTIECWARRDGSTNNNVFTLGSYDKGLEIYIDTDNKIGVYGLNSSGGSEWIIPKNSNHLITPGLWYHIALVRHSGTLKLYVNGMELGSTSHNYQVPATDEDKDFFIGIEISSSDSIPGANPYFDGEISNVRVVKGTAVYTSAFRPPTAPLSNITNTKLLCCQNSTATGYTVSPGTIGDSSSPSAITDSPFDDPEGFVFGGSGSENVVKCGSYTGNGSFDGQEINLGWEPQWLLIRRMDNTSEDWTLYDAMRGIGDKTIQYKPAYNYADITSLSRFKLTSTGFRIIDNDNDINGNGVPYLYTAIRRPDGYVGKPADAGTDVFAMDTGAGSSTIPNFDSTFPIDFALRKNTNNAGTNWRIAARLIQDKFLEANNTSAISTSTSLASFDSNVGFGTDGADTNYQAWMFKRHSGFDVVNYKGDGASGRQVPHSLNAVPEMIWVKNWEDNGEEWIVYHKGLDSGNQPETHNLYLHDSDAELDTNAAWNDTAPTSTHFTLGGGNAVNKSTKYNLAFLFASVTGISSVGFYDGSSSDVTVTTGFSPRFIIIKAANEAFNWTVWDTTRGLTGSGNDARLYLNTDGAQNSDNNYITGISSTGFTVGRPGGSSLVNGSYKYIYYAHA